jgi:DNA-directed RNA polymerase omega subunit
MKVKTLSRGHNIDTERCVENIGGNRFDLVLIASARARELSYRHKNADQTSQLNAPVAALLDVQEGQVGREYLKKV